MLLIHAIVRDQYNNVVRLVEVKCPYKARSKDTKEMHDHKSFCCSLVNGEPVLKKEHDYFFLIQGQMTISGIHRCDFIVWSPVNFIVILILIFEFTIESLCFLK